MKAELVALRLGRGMLSRCLAATLGHTLRGTGAASQGPWVGAAEAGCGQTVKGPLGARARAGPSLKRRLLRPLRNSALSSALSREARFSSFPVRLAHFFAPSVRNVRGERGRPGTPSISSVDI